MESGGSKCLLRICHSFPFLWERTCVMQSQRKKKRSQVWSSRARASADLRKDKRGRVWNSSFVNEFAKQAALKKNIGSNGVGVSIDQVCEVPRIFRREGIKTLSD